MAKWIILFIFIWFAISAIPILNYKIKLRKQQKLEKKTQLNYQRTLEERYNYWGERYNYWIESEKQQEREEREREERERKERERKERERKEREQAEINQLMNKIKNEPELRYIDWDKQSNDVIIDVRSRQALNNYDDIKYFKKEDNEKLDEVLDRIKQKQNNNEKIKDFLANNRFSKNQFYYRVKMELSSLIQNGNTYNIKVNYISSADNLIKDKIIRVTEERIRELKAHPEFLMNASELNKFLKEKEKEALSQKQHDYYEDIKALINYVNENKELLITKNDKKELDDLITQMINKTVNNIKKIKNLKSEEWDIIDDCISQSKKDIKIIIEKNQKILNYYDSEDFLKIKSTCEFLMNSKKEFNEYINEKAESIAKLLGTRVVRNETIREDKNNYIPKYNKTLTPFTANVSKDVFASAENNSLKYVMKYFYPNKDLYPEQIQKLQLLIEELETLKDAKEIIENYKKEYEEYIKDVPSYVIDNDKDGFYSRLGFANIDESVLNIEYKFVYTSNEGMNQKWFPVPMTQENISELINMLSNKLTTKSFTKEQRALMTKQLRENIKRRDNYTCCNCGNSTNKEPNLLLEIDHIIPVSKGGYTEEKNLQTLCWKCNRKKGNKITQLIQD